MARRPRHEITTFEDQLGEMVLRAFDAAAARGELPPVLDACDSYVGRSGVDLSLYFHEKGMYRISIRRVRDGGY